MHRALRTHGNRGMLVGNMSFRFDRTAPLQPMQVLHFSNENTATSWGDDDSSKKGPAVTSPGSTGSPGETYHGKFGKRLRNVRRISLSSSIFSVIGFPLGIMLGNSATMPLTGQLAMAGTIIFTSVSSTAFLQLVCRSYVTSLEELPSTKTVPGPGGKGTIIDRRFRATRLNIFGNKTTSEFHASEIEKIKKSLHPFATFTARGSTYYVHKPSVPDQTIAELL
jgi:hypothetical protein